MSKQIRLYFFYIYALFFVITVPFLIIFSLGYDLDFSKRELANSLTISIDARPRSIETYNNNQRVLQGNGELRAREGDIIALSIQHEGYFNENFLLWARPNQNSTARLTNLWMLPKNDEVRWIPPSGTILHAILSENFLLFSRENQLFVQTYDVGGLQSDPQPIQAVSPIAQESLSSGIWRKLRARAFWNPKNGIIIAEISGQWRLFTTDVIPQPIVSLALTQLDEAIVLDQQSNLWIWNIITGTTTFVDSGWSGVSYTEIPDLVWLLRGSTIYRIAPSRIDRNSLFDNERFATRQYTPQPSLKSSSAFVVKTVYQGVLVKIASNLYYIPDNDRTNWMLIANDATVYSTSDNTALWLNSRGELVLYNFFLKQLKTIPGFATLTNNDADLLTLFYLFEWRRVVVYTPDKVYAVWYDKDIINTSVVSYSPILWIDNKKCATVIQDRHQFCILDNKLISYRNTSLW